MHLWKNDQTNLQTNFLLPLVGGGGGGGGLICAAIPTRAANPVLHFKALQY